MEILQRLSIKILQKVTSPGKTLYVDVLLRSETKHLIVTHPQPSGFKLISSKIPPQDRYYYSTHHIIGVESLPLLWYCED